MNGSDKYICELKRLLTGIGKDGKKYYLKLKNDIIENYSDLKYEELLNRFGDPSEIADAFFSEIDQEVIQRKIKIKKVIIVISAMIVLLLLLFLFFYYTAINNAENSFIHKEEVIIEEIK